MPAFIEECRYEWKRLGVPDSMAEEMATELEADLAEAEADGISAAEILGESDPRRFAATWASERGLVSDPPPKKSRKGLWIGLAVGFVLVFVALPALALISVGSGSISTVRSPQPVRSLVIQSFVGFKACRAERIALEARSQGPQGSEEPLQRSGHSSEAVARHADPVPPEEADDADAAAAG